MDAAGQNTHTSSRVYVTLAGLPLLIELKWPFHKSGAGADFWVLHGDIKLGGTEGLDEAVSVNLSATVREVLPTLGPKDAEAAVINSLRYNVDRRQLEFVKSGKLVPVQFSSRHYDFRRNKWVFGKASDEDSSLLIARKVFWQRRLTESAAWIGDPTEALYVETTREHGLEVARKLAGGGVIAGEGERGVAHGAVVREADKV